MFVKNNACVKRGVGWGWFFFFSPLKGQCEASSQKLPVINFSKSEPPTHLALKVFESRHRFTASHGYCEMVE